MISVFLVKAVPATFRNIDSSPRQEEELAPAQPELRAQGLMSNSVAPACPARSGLPAYPAAEWSRNAPGKAIVKQNFENFFITLYFYSVNSFFSSGLELELVEVKRPYHT